LSPKASKLNQGVKGEIIWATWERKVYKLLARNLLERHSIHKSIIQQWILKEGAEWPTLDSFGSEQESCKHNNEPLGYWATFSLSRTASWRKVVCLSIV
jgi:3-methyladenine DNA glycosylase AlkD